MTGRTGHHSTCSNRLSDRDSFVPASLLVLVVQLVLSSCTFVPGVYYGGADADERDRQVWTNMRDLQTAAEHYAANHGGDYYPTDIDDSFKSYLPGGGDDNQTPRPVGLINPFTGANEWPAKGSPKDITALRNGSPPWLPPGKIEYSPIGDGKGYAIIGGGHDGRTLRDYDGKVLVFTNFTDEELAEHLEK